MTASRLPPGAAAYLGRWDGELGTLMARFPLFPWLGYALCGTTIGMIWLRGVRAGRTTATVVTLACVGAVVGFVTRDGSPWAFAFIEAAALDAVNNEVPAQVQRNVLAAVHSSRRGRTGGTVLEWLKVPAGPRYATRRICSSERHADMISRNSRATVSSDSGPVLRAFTARSTCASRSGR